VDCDIIQVENSYLLHVPAPPSTFGNNKSEIIMNFDLLSILQISEVLGVISMQFQLEMTWRDPRITFLNLKQNINQNTVGIIDAIKIWYPKVIFFNTKDREETVVMDVT
jgi:hypothetical protein